MLVVASAAAPDLASRARPRNPHSVSSTAYCLQGRMADGHRVYFGAVASNRHPLGTLLRFKRPVHGKRHFRVRDRIGHGSELDIWLPSCGSAIRYGRRQLRYRVHRRTR